MRQDVDPPMWQIPVHEIHEFSNKQHSFAVVAIMWNEGDRIKNQLRQMQSQLKHVDIILSDGYSTDGSVDSDFLRSMHVRALLQTHEIGLGCAIRVGLAYCLDQGYDGIITIDGNNKDGVEAIEQMIEKLEAGYDCIQASRFMKGGKHYNTPLERYIGVRYVIAPILALGCGFWFTDPTNGFKGLSRAYLLDEKVQPLRHVFKKFNMQYYLNYRAPKLGFKTTEIPARRGYPSDGSVPTRIHGLKTRFFIVWELLLTVCGYYNPKK